MTHYDYASEDLRVKRTHKLVLEALLDQTVQKGFAALTVRPAALGRKLRWVKGLREKGHGQSRTSPSSSHCFCSITADYAL